MDAVSISKFENMISEIITFMDLTHKGWIIFNHQGEIIKNNYRFLEIFKLSENDGLNKNINEMINRLRSEKKTQGIYNLDDQQVHVKTKRISVTKKVYYDVWIFAIIGTESIRKSLLEAIVNYSQDGIEAIDNTGKMIIYNEAQGKIDNYKPSEVINRHAEEIYSLDDESSLLLKVLKTEKPIKNVRQTYYTKRGTYVDCVTNAIPLFHSGKIFGSASIVRDYNAVLNSLSIPENSKKVSKVSRKQSSPKDTRYVFDQILTRDNHLLNVIEAAKYSADSRSSIMIIGETGTGKEMFAQSIHAFGKRAQKPFIAINCAAIPESLLEGLLFGTTKGSFTGAIDKEGIFESANGGTIFLDEINSMSLFLQAKLLRVLEERVVTRLGSNKTIEVNARIISSANENPYQGIKKKTFRRDLFYRLAVVYLVIPPLRERLDDVPYLTENFIQHYNIELNKKIEKVSGEVSDFFETYNWPGNVRQLRHLLESAMNILPADKEIIELSDLPEYIIGGDQKKNQIGEESLVNEGNYGLEEKLDEEELNDDIFEYLETKEKQLIIKTLKQTNGNIAKAAELLKMSRQKLYYRLKKYKLK